MTSAKGAAAALLVAGGRGGRHARRQVALGGGRRHAAHCAWHAVDAHAGRATLTNDSGRPLDTYSLDHIGLWLRDPTGDDIEVHARLTLAERAAMPADQEPTDLVPGTES